MSHVTTIKCEVQITNEATLKSALEEVAKEEGGTVEMNGYYIDYYGEKHKADLVLRTKTFERGIGFTKIGEEAGNPRYEIKVDQFGHEGVVTKLINKVKQHYSGEMIEKELQNDGYFVTKKKEKQKLVLEATY